MAALRRAVPGSARAGAEGTAGGGAAGRGAAVGLRPPQVSPGAGGTGIGRAVRC